MSHQGCRCLAWVIERQGRLLVVMLLGISKVVAWLGVELSLIRRTIYSPSPEFAVDVSVDSGTFPRNLPIVAVYLGDYSKRLACQDAGRLERQALQARNCKAYLYIDSDGSSIRLCETRFNCYRLPVAT